VYLLNEAKIVGPVCGAVHGGEHASEPTALAGADKDQRIEVAMGGDQGIIHVSGMTGRMPQANNPGFGEPQYRRPSHATVRPGAMPGVDGFDEQRYPRTPSTARRAVRRE